MRKNKALTLAVLWMVSVLAVTVGAVLLLWREDEKTVRVEPNTLTVIEPEPGDEAPAPFVPQLAPKEGASAEHYTLPEEAELPNGSIGRLVIPSIGLSAPVFETEDEMEAMRQGIAHYSTTSAWLGNIGLCAHNGTAPQSYFHRLHEVQAGDELTYETALGTRTYVVETVQEIHEPDWSLLGRTEDNRITMTTCIDGKPEYRLCVQAVEKTN